MKWLERRVMQCLSSDWQLHMLLIQQMDTVEACCGQGAFALLRGRMEHVGDRACKHHLVLALQGHELSGALQEGKNSKTYGQLFIV